MRPEDSTLRLFPALSRTGRFNSRAREARPSSTMPSPPRTSFKPRAREGLNSNLRSSCKGCRVRFNPRAREGSTYLEAEYTLAPTSFNPRAREGSTATLLTSKDRAASFNPRAREGSTMTGFSDCAYLVFQPASPRGLDFLAEYLLENSHVSTREPARARRDSQRSRRAYRRFNPRAREGSTAPRPR